MSFGGALKNEILQNKALRSGKRKAQSYGLFLFGASFTREEISLRSGSPGVIELYMSRGNEIFGRNIFRSTGGSEKNFFRAAVAEERDREKLLEYFGSEAGVNREILSSAEEVGAFLSGVYLACGHMTDPEKDYHIEFVTSEEKLRDELWEILGDAIPNPLTVKRRGKFVIYYKECLAIEDLLALMGAAKSSLAVIDIESYRSVRNMANRTTNCETANIDKTVAASLSQEQDIKLVLENENMAPLSNILRNTALLRLENPEASLRELAELSGGSVSRSGIHHRLAAISKIAAELRGKGCSGE